jgi:hypothetical protein
MLEDSKLGRRWAAAGMQEGSSKRAAHGPSMSPTSQTPLARHSPNANDSHLISITGAVDHRSICRCPVHRDNSDKSPLSLPASAHETSPPGQHNHSGPTASP